MLGVDWLTPEVIGLSLLSASLSLFAFGVSAGILNDSAELNSLIFVTGILSIVIFSSTKAPYENYFILSLIILAGIVTFMSTIVLVKYNAPLVNTVLSYSVNMAFLLPQLHNLRVVDNAKIIKRNIIYQTLMFAVRIVWALM